MAVSTLPDLIPETRLRPLEGELRRRFAAVRGEFHDIGEDDRYEVALRFFLLFGRWSDLLSEITPELTPTVQFYNRYYWFRRLKSLWTQRHGADAGMEQQALQLLEGADCDGYWSVIEAIEQQVDAEMRDSHAG